jgi:hypothetical protein
MSKMAFRGTKGCFLVTTFAFTVAIFVGIWVTLVASSQRLVFDPVSNLNTGHTGSRERTDTQIDPHRAKTIPHIIHQTWNTYNIPKELAAWVKTWMTFNPHWEYYLWTSDNVKALSKERYPTYLRMYESYGFTIFRADAMRYFIMDSFGGFYVDLDMECLQPLDEWTFDNQCILSHETYEHPYLLHDKTAPNVMTTMLASRPGHPFFKACIEALPAAAEEYPTDVMRGTGPWFLDKVYNEYIKSPPARLPENNITVVHPKYFLPTFDPPGTEKLRRQCIVLKDKLVPHALQVCEDLQSRNFSNNPLPESYTNHHWVHIFLEEAKWRNKRDVVSIFELVPDVQIY